MVLGELFLSLLLAGGWLKNRYVLVPNHSEAELTAREGSVFNTSPLYKTTPGKVGEYGECLQKISQQIKSVWIVLHRQKLSIKLPPVTPDMTLRPQKA